MFKNGASETVGLIAGAGELPVLFAQAGKSIKKRIVVFDVDGSADPRLKTIADEVHRFAMGDLKVLAELLKGSGVKSVALAGTVSKRNYYDDSFKMDDEAKKVVQSTKNKGDDHLLRAVQLFLKIKCGVSVLDPRVFLKNTTADKGVMTKRQPTAEEWQDLRLGQRTIKVIGKMDIGQTVVVKKGIVLAVEALEGTDEAIKRGAALGKGGVVVVKAAKPRQSLRFDLPCVGRETLQNMKALSSAVLGVEAGKTILISKQQLIEMADREDMVLVGL